VPRARVPLTPKPDVIVGRRFYNRRMTCLSPTVDAQQIVLPPDRRTLYVLWLLFWLIMIVVAVQDTLFNDDIAWWEPLLWEGSSCVFATCWFLLAPRAQRRYGEYLDRPARWLWLHLQWLPLMALTFLATVYPLRHAVYTLVGRTYMHEPWSFVLVYETLKLGLFAGLWFGILFAFASFQRWREERQRLLALQKSLADAQLGQLRAQLRPHFFFNVLNTISALMHVDVDRADRLLARLADLLRSTLQAGEQEMTSLREELRLLELYAQVMQERFTGRVEVAWHIEPEALAAEVPALLLQPLLENAFKHGVEPSREPIRIEICAGRRGAELWIAIRNTGPLSPSDASPGVGLRNVQERLRVIYGSEARFELRARDGWTEAGLTLPWRAQVPT
jgi:hypothetical protein